MKLPVKFNPDHGIIEFGVGKNMVKAIDYWAQVTGVLERKKRAEFLVSLASRSSKSTTLI